MRFLLLFAALLLTLSTAHAEGRFDQGKMNLGLGAGGGSSSTSSSFSISASFGYFVIDRLRPSIAVSYRWQDFDGFGSTHEVNTNLALRYYLVETDTVSPFLVVDGGHVHLVDNAFFKDDFDYFSIFMGGGATVAITDNFGLDIILGAIRYLGVDDKLIDRKVVDDGFAFYWTAGFTVSF